MHSVDSCKRFKVFCYILMTVARVLRSSNGHHMVPPCFGDSCKGFKVCSYILLTVARDLKNSMILMTVVRVLKFFLTFC